MTGRGRYKALEWAEFEPCYLENGKLDKQRCRHCNAKVSSKIERIKEHLKKCLEYVKQNSVGNDSGNDDVINEATLPRALEIQSSVSDTQPSTSMTTSNDDACDFHPFFASTPSPCSKRSQSSISNVSNTSVAEKSTDMTDCEGSATRLKKQKSEHSHRPSMDRFLYKTSPAEKELLDLQGARAFYACNIPFLAAENEHMKQYISMLRGGSYQIPSRKQLSTTLLDKVYTECKEILATNLKGKEVTLIQDGWSNVHNQPIIASCLHDGTKSYFVRSVDTGSEKKTADYCTKSAEEEIKFVEEEYNCKVSESFSFTISCYLV